MAQYRGGLGSADDVQVQTLRLKIAGTVTGRGRAFAACTLAWFALLAHSGFAQWQAPRGATACSDRGHVADLLRDGPTDGGGPAGACEAAVAFERADRWGLVGVPEVKLGRAWVAILRGDHDDAERLLRESVRRGPRCRFSTRI